MIIPFHFNILLGFLIPSIIYIKRGIGNNSTGNDSETATNEYEDMTRTKSEIKNLIDKGVIDKVE